MLDGILEWLIPVLVTINGVIVLLSAALDLKSELEERAERNRRTRVEEVSGSLSLPGSTVEAPAPAAVYANATLQEQGSAHMMTAMNSLNHLDYMNRMNLMDQKCRNGMLQFR